MNQPDTVFDDENDAFEYIRARLAETLPERLATAIAHQFEVYCGMDRPLDDWPRANPAATESEEPFVSIGAPFLGPWTVREQELSDVRGIAALALALSTADAGRRLSPLVSLVMAAACMIWRLRKRGVSVSPLQRDVLIVLRRARAISLEHLAGQVGAMGADWSRKDVEGALQELRAIRLNDGSVVALVHQADDGLWSTDARGLWEVPFGSSG